MIEGHTKKLPRRRLLQLAAGAVALPAVSRIAHAQAYPTKPVRLIVGFAAGGTFDTVARPMAQWLWERYRQQFVIENRPGGGGTIGTEAALPASPDGHTLLLVGPNNRPLDRACRGAPSTLQGRTKCWLIRSGGSSGCGRP
jgi:tripartite-type tricarboxylate transporter receptor subunit TctC